MTAHNSPGPLDEALLVVAFVAMIIGFGYEIGTGVWHAVRPYFL